MFDRILIDGIVIIYPYELDQNINDIIIKKLASKYIVCNKKYGCVTKINKIHNQYKTYIERNTSNIKVHIKFMVERILPRIGKRLNCKVHMIFNHGIFAQIDQHIKILIPIASIKSGKFIQNTPDGSIFQIEQNKSNNTPASNDSDSNNDSCSSESNDSDDDDSCSSESNDSDDDDSCSSESNDSDEDDSCSSESDDSDEDDSCSSEDKIQRIIKTGDLIKIKITDVKYNKNRYNCIGKLCKS